MREGAAGETERPRERDVDSARPQYLIGDRALRLAGEQARDVHRVAASVEERAAVQLGVEADVRPGGRDEAEEAPDQSQLTDRSRPDQANELVGLRVVPELE